MRRGRPPRRQSPPDPWLARLRLSALRGRLPFGRGGVILPEYSGSIPEPAEELPDSDLSDSEQSEAVERERWRRQGRG
ncbi:MAG TPA: hypothetical protein VH951_08645 [Dehalococcoidia bacterium]